MKIIPDIHQFYAVLFLRAGLEPKQGVCRAEPEDTCREGHNTNPAPDDILSDDLLTE
jgi:hypothetical protein